MTYLSKYLNIVTNYPQAGCENLPEHLGGGRDRCHQDVGALAWIVETFAPKRMIDVGCGLGCMVNLMREAGIEAIGIDGDPHGRPDFCWDFRDGPFPDPPPADVVWSMEFLEHVDEDYIPNIMDLFARSPVVVCTHAPPGKPGHHHVNCQEELYWRERFEEHGFRFDAEKTAELRAASNMRSIEADGTCNPNKKKRFVVDHGLVFVK